LRIDERLGDRKRRVGVSVFQRTANGERRTVNDNGDFITEAGELRIADFGLRIDERLGDRKRRVGVSVFRRTANGER
jgi:hypothetical protein